MPRHTTVKVKADEQSIAVLKRLMAYVFRSYRTTCLLVFILIIISAMAGVASSLFIKTLIDDYIVPLLQQANPSFDTLLAALKNMAIIFLLGTISTYVYNRLLIEISQGTMKQVRDDLFAHTLIPITTVISCRYIPMIPIPCVKSYHKVYRNLSLHWSRSLRYLYPCVC